MIARRAVLALPAAGCAAAAQPTRLASPFDGARLRRSGAARRPAACRPAPPPVHDLEGVSFYTDGAFSVPDPARLAADNAASEPLRQFLDAAQRPLAAWLDGGPPEDAACALAALDSWAQAAALLGRFNNQGGYHRKWTLSGASLAYLQLRDAPGLDPAALARTGAWLARVAEAVRPFYDRAPRPGTISSSANNHSAWAGLAVGAAGIAAGRRDLFDWGAARLDGQLAQLTPEGGLPMELARGRMARHYHFFALWALGPLARLLRANGRGFDEARFARLIAFTLRAVEEPAEITRLSGAEPGELTANARPPLSNAHGIEAWLPAAPDAALSQKLAPFRPFRHRWLGGDVTRIFA
jgi:poly(beta-D-mannuronate) lyase